MRGIVAGEERSILTVESAVDQFDGLGLVSGTAWLPWAARASLVLPDGIARGVIFLFAP